MQPVTACLCSIKRTVLRFYDVEPQSLESTQLGKVNEPRNVAINLARKRSGLRLVEIGSEYGLSKYSSVSSIVCRTEQQLSKNTKVRDRIETIRKELEKSQAKT